MRKLSVPINITTLTEKNLPLYLEQVKSCGAKRVFVCGIEDICDTQAYSDSDRLKKIIDFFKQNDIEIGIWINSFGHGGALTGVDQSSSADYTQMAGFKGESGEFSNCPLDENFVKDFCTGAKELAKLNPDMIMLDDDFRINPRSGYYLGCFCELHIKKYYKRIGKEVPREKLEELIFTGGKNEYRTEYMKLMAESVLNFAQKLRNAVDEVNPTIRLGACCCMESWDFNGTDAIEIAKTLAGNTKPFMRTLGAPYWDSNIIGIIEDTRLQASWGADAGVEVFGEGDTYPRPRYIPNSPSRPLELFDFVLTADGTADGILKYMFDYTYKPDFELGYVKNHIKNDALRQQIKSIFAGKKTVGIYSFNAMHKIENWEMPTELSRPQMAIRLMCTYQSASREML